MVNDQHQQNLCYEPSMVHNNDNEPMSKIEKYMRRNWKEMNQIWKEMKFP